MPDLASARPSRPRPALRRLVALLLLALTSALALAPPAGADVRSSRLTRAQERVVLRLIDDVCGDTWCEGDHALRFDRLRCHPRRAACALVVQIAPWSDEPLQWQRRSRLVRGFVRFDDMVATAPDGTRSLRPAFVEAVGEAVLAMAAAVPQPGVPATVAPPRAEQAPTGALVPEPAQPGGCTP